MIEKSDDLRRTLLEIDNLLQTMWDADVESNLEQEDIDFLQRSRRSIVALLETRRKLNLRNIVSLKGWRDGSVIIPQITTDDYATMVRPSQLRRRIPRPYLVS